MFHLAAFVLIPLLTVLCGLGMGSSAHAEDGTFNLGLVTFLSGGAAGPFGVPARNAAELVIEAINKRHLARALRQQGSRRHDDRADDHR